MANSNRQPIRSNVLTPPAEVIESVITLAADKLFTLDGAGCRQWCLTISGTQAVIVDLEEGNDAEGAVWVRAKNDDGVVFPLTIALGVTTIIRGPKYGKALRLKIKRSTVDGVAQVHLYAQ